jgi:hypothetical protein
MSTASGGFGIKKFVKKTEIKTRIAAREKIRKILS